jgi:hypothetical protein
MLLHIFAVAQKCLSLCQFLTTSLPRPWHLEAFHVPPPFPPRVAASASIAVVALWPASVQTNHVPVSRNINDYVLFAYDTLEFKGQNACPSCGQILGGHVGANAVAGAKGNPTLSLGSGGSGHKVFMSDDTQVAGDSVRIGNTSSVFQLYANKVQAGFNAAAVVRHGGPTHSLPRASRRTRVPSSTRPLCRRIRFAAREPPGWM